jgi:putative ABC transport system permease protein
MMGLWLLAWRYISCHRGRTAILVSAIALTAFLPLTTRWAIKRFEEKAYLRAQQTPLLIGSQGGRFGLTLHALYFRGEAPSAIKYAELQRVEQFKLAEVIPMHAKFRTRGTLIVGTTPAYFSLRRLVLASGDALERLGDCVVGAKVARELRIHTADRLVSEPANMFDLSGAWPLKLRVTGILQPNGTPDDEVIFCDLQTAWLMEGIGHGHASSSASTSAQSEHVHNASQQNLQRYEEVTDANSGSFHFHGRLAEYPLTALIALPDSERSSALLQGKYLDPASDHQIVQPIEVIQELTQTISQVRQLFDVGMLFLSMVTVILIALVLMLSIRLREAELHTLFMLGCSRTTVVKIISLELLIVLLMAVAVGSVLSLLVIGMAESWLIQLL